MNCHWVHHPVSVQYVLFKSSPILIFLTLFQVSSRSIWIAIRDRINISYHWSSGIWRRYIHVQDPMLDETRQHDLCLVFPCPCGLYHFNQYDDAVLGNLQVSMKNWKCIYHKCSQSWISHIAKIPILQSSILYKSIIQKSPYYFLTAFDSALSSLHLIRSKKLYL